MWQSIKNFYHLIQACLANLIYGFPSRKLTVVGITGTDGKTTTAHMLYRILRDSGKKGIVITTVGALINDEQYAIGLHVTTPSSFTVQKLLRTAVQKGCTYAVLETTSHALDQNRVAGIHFSIGILTNITNEHLDYHKTYERYTQAKCILLKAADTAIINYDDRSYELLVRTLRSDKIISYSAVNQKAKYTPMKYPFKLQLLGSFNVMNALAAYAAAEKLGLAKQDIVQSLQSFTAPKGRQEIVYDQDFRIIVDFAHTPNALENIFRAAKETTKGRLIVLFGSAGKRDTKKRPDMGRAAARYASTIILTADDPRDENVLAINAMIAQGIAGFTKLDPGTIAPAGMKLLYAIPDRQQAIDFAIQIAKPGDTIVLAGKGHEQSLAMAEGEITWDERKAVEKALMLRSENQAASS